MTDIPLYSTFIKIKPVVKGWSGDKKYCVETADGKRMLLRISDVSEYDRKKAEYGMMERVYKLGVLTSEPIGFGLCCDGKSCYSLSGWLDGEDAEKALPLISETEQYMLGLKAGETLRKIHTLPAPEDAEPWSDWFCRKVQGRIDFYNENPINSENGDLIVRYLQNMMHLLNHRPQTFVHGDFNISNMIIMPDKKIGVIDFNSYNKDHGDPWWEFDPCMDGWGSEPSAHFHTGLIKGYFNGEPPSDFFDVFSYYLAHDALAAICDTSVRNQGEPEVGKRHMENILRWFDNMKNPVPTWYLSGYEVWDVYDKDRNKTGRLHERGKPMPTGDYHIIVHVWKHNSKGEWLIDKRTPRYGRGDFDGKWETTGGCAVVGDDSLNAALRETREELGVNLDPQCGELFSSTAQKWDDGHTAFIDVWVFEYNESIESVVFDEREVCDAMWASADTIKSMMTTGEFLDYSYFDEMVMKTRTAK